MSLKKQFFLLVLVCSCMKLSESKVAAQHLLKIQNPLKAKKFKKKSQRILNKNLLSNLSLSSQESTQGKQKKIKFKTKPNTNQNEVEEKADKNIETEKLVLSGAKKKLIKSDVKRFTSPFPTEKEIDFIIGKYLQEKPKKEELFCPSDYDLQNNYSLYGEIDFINVKKDSCLGEESKETYSLNKKWIVEKKDKKNLISAYNKILKWLLDLFFFPYLPASLKKAPKDFKEYKLDQACPSCSFRFEYNYRYNSAGFIDFDVKAICKDKKYAFSRVKQDSYIINNWSCVKKP